MFTAIETDRLQIRSFTEGDVDDLVARRNHPDVARYQNWELPYTREAAESMVAGIIEMDGPANDEWWMAVVGERDTGQVIGDLAVHLSWQGRTAEIGYTFDREHWGQGFAGEAAEALVAYLFETLGVTRVFGMLHPDNPASAMVLERAGLLFEGHTRSSFWVGDDCSDDWIYGMTRDDWETWRDRPRNPPAQVGLVEVDADNYQQVYALRTHKSQERFVATMADSFADALFPEVVEGAPVVPWMRAVVADGKIVGFVMIAISTEHHPEPYLWRLLIDRLHQRRGIGKATLDLVIDECRQRGDRTLLVSWEEGKGSPRNFYVQSGFMLTGLIVDGETEARRQL